MRKCIFKYLLMIFSFIFFQSQVFAAATEASAPATSSMNEKDIALYVLAGVIILFVFIIYILSSAIKMASKTYMQKLKDGKETAKKTLSLILILIMSTSTQLFAQEVEGKAVTPPYSFDNWTIYLLSFVVFLLFVVVLVMVRTLFILLGIKKESAETVMVDGKPGKVRTWFQKFNETVPIEDEAALDMSHDYDGIRELDNKIPSWWMWAMFSFVLFAIIYLYRMFGSETLDNQYVELEKANEIAEIQKAAYLSKSANNVDETNVVMLTGADLAEGATLYAKNCVACHGDKGQGGVGPNFGDKYWLHKGGIKDIFYSVKYGWTEKGMKAWKDDFSPMQIAQIASFVKSLEGSNPAGGKEQQGVLDTEVAATDSTKVEVPKAASDSTK